MGVGGSTKAGIHLIAIAGRLGIDLSMAMFDEVGKETPIVANLRPAGKYQMQEFFHAGGAPAVMEEISDMLHLDQRTVTGKTIGENIEDAAVSPTYREVIYPVGDPLYHDGGLGVLRGNLAPGGA